MALFHVKHTPNKMNQELLLSYTKLTENDIQDVLDIAIGVALFGRVPDASLDMVFEDEKSDGVYRCPQSRRLLEDVDAVFTALDHALDATDLARDAAQPPNQDRLIA